MRVAWPRHRLPVAGMPVAGMPVAGTPAATRAGPGPGALLPRPAQLPLSRPISPPCSGTGRLRVNLRQTSPSPSPRRRPSPLRRISLRRRISPWRPSLRRKLSLGRTRPLRTSPARRPRPPSMLPGYSPDLGPEMPQLPERSSRRQTGPRTRCTETSSTVPPAPHRRRTSRRCPRSRRVPPPGAAGRHPGLPVRRPRISQRVPSRRPRCAPQCSKPGDPPRFDPVGRRAVSSASARPHGGPRSVRYLT